MKISGTKNEISALIDIREFALKKGWEVSDIYSESTLDATLYIIPRDKDGK